MGSISLSTHVDVADAFEQDECLFTWSLEGIAPNDGTEATADMYPSHFLKQLLIVPRRSA
jgi:hypothetical protein